MLFEQCRDHVGTPRFFAISFRKKLTLGNAPPSPRMQVGWWAGWLGGWWAGWLGWLAGLAGWWLVGWLAGWLLAGWLGMEH